MGISSSLLVGGEQGDWLAGRRIEDDGLAVADARNLALKRLARRRKRRNERNRPTASGVVRTLPSAPLAANIQPCRRARGYVQRATLALPSSSRSR